MLPHLTHFHEIIKLVTNNEYIIYVDLRELLVDSFHASVTADRRNGEVPKYRIYITFLASYCLSMLCHLNSSGKLEMGCIKHI